MKRIEERKYEKRVSLLSSLTVIMIFIIKMIAAIFTNSLSFFAELSDSILDFAALAITIFGLWMSQKPADAEHMYGHAKVNSLASVFQAFLIIILYVYIIYLGIQNLINYKNYTIQNPGDGIISLVLCLIIVLLVSRYIVMIGNKTNNALIKAQGLNFQGDYYRNVAIIIGLIIASFGFAIIDIILAIIVSIRSLYGAISIVRQGFSELLDYNSIDPDDINSIKNTIESWDDVEQVEKFTVRTFGSTLDTAISIVMKNTVTMACVDEYTDRVKKYIKEHFPNFRCNVVVQITTPDQKPEDYEQVFEKIRKANQKVSEIHNIHNISVDVLQEKILIQFHFDIAENIDLTEAHHKATLLEDLIRLEFPKEYHSKLEIVSHIEPERMPGGVYPNSSPRLKKSIRGHIEAAIQSIPEIKAWDHPIVLEEGGKISISLTAFLDGKMAIFEVHQVTKKLEDNLKAEIPTLNRCIIHSEPLLPV